MSNDNIPGLVFVSFNHPEEAERGSVKRAVRSRAAYWSHQVRPAKYQPRPPSAVRPSRFSVPPTTSAYVAGSNDHGDVARRKSSSSKATNRANIGRKRKRSRSPSPDPRNAALISARRRLPSPLYLDASRKDPFDTLPVPYLPWFGSLLDFWYTGVIPKARKFVKMTPVELEGYVRWSRNFEMQDPCSYYTSLFLATGIPVATGKLSIEKALWLRGQAVHALNEALNDPLRATSDASISTVGKIALHEHMHGDRAAAHSIHRPAQQRMIALRGGVEQLGFPSIVLQLFSWYDAFMAAESGTPAYFSDLPRKLAIKSFSNEEAVRVTTVVSPDRHHHPGYGIVPRSMQHLDRSKVPTNY